jgi:hypothetical protein
VGAQQLLLALLQPLALLGRPRLVFQGELYLDEFAARVALLGQPVGVGHVRRQVVRAGEEGALQRLPHVGHGMPPHESRPSHSMSPL